MARIEYRENGAFTLTDPRDTTYTQMSEVQGLLNDLLKNKQRWVMEVEKSLNKNRNFFIDEFEIASFEFDNAGINLFKADGGVIFISSPFVLKRVEYTPENGLSFHQEWENGSTIKHSFR